MEFPFNDFDKRATKYYHFTFMCASAACFSPVPVIEIDSVKFARDRQTVSGTLPLVAFVRLHDSLWPPAPGKEIAGDVMYVVRGGEDAQSRPVLRLKLESRLRLQCQRCLGELMHELAIDTTLRLVPEAALDVEQSDDPDEPDCIAARTALDLAELIEDEILLALPAYPHHEEGGCGEAAGKAGAGKVSAFSALEMLKQKTFTSKE